MRNIVFILLVLLNFGCEGPKDKITNPIGMTFVYIKPGKFIMGPRNEAYQQKNHREVTLTKGFYIQTTETTVGQWKKFINSTGYSTQAEKKGYSFSHQKYKYDYYRNRPGSRINGLSWNNPGYKFTDRHPVTHISWKDSQKFIEWLNTKFGKYYRLATEAEWEYACRAGTNTHFYNGNLSKRIGRVEDKKLNEIAWYGFNSMGYPHQVGLNKPNDWGLYDMLGNIDEYCLDYYKFTISDNPIEDPLNTDESLLLKTLRGGACRFTPSTTTCSSRGGTDVIFSSDQIGFRVVKDVAPEDVKKGNKNGR